MKKAFTLIELMVAVGILAIVLSFAGVVFNAGIDTYRTSAANAEIMRNFRAITDRLDADFEGLRKDGEIFVTWVAAPTALPGDCDLDGFERFDRIMFFAIGEPDFQSYRTTPMIRGRTARISYMLATKDTAAGPVRAQSQARAERILARTQHILTADTTLTPSLDPNSLIDQDWYYWHNRCEYDLMVSPDESLSLNEWKHIPWDQKQDMLAVVTDVDVGTSTILPGGLRGAHVDPADANTIHILLCEGVGEFKVQGWSYDSVRGVWRWIPEVDIDGPGPLTDSDFFPVGDPCVPGTLYPYRMSVSTETYGGVSVNNLSFPQSSVTEANFNNIPGLGRVLKFTFTLFDSKGIIEQGRTFTHIVYLDK